MSYILALVIQILFNIMNSIFDAYLISKNKTIAHAVNFLSYAGIISIELLTLKTTVTICIVWCIEAFTCRQLFFDIPLNLRRGLAWDYVTPAQPPKAIMDRIEIWIFGRDGKLTNIVYITFFILSITFLCLQNNGV